MDLEKRKNNHRKSIAIKAIITACTVGQIVALITSMTCGISSIIMSVDRLGRSEELLDTLSYLKEGGGYRHDISSKFEYNLELLQSKKISLEEFNLLNNKVVSDVDFLDWARKLDNPDVQAIIAQHDRDVAEMDSMINKNNCALGAGFAVGIGATILDRFAQKKEKEIEKKLKKDDFEMED